MIFFLFLIKESGGVDSRCMDDEQNGRRPRWKTRDFFSFNDVDVVLTTCLIIRRGFPLY